MDVPKGARGVKTDESEFDEGKELCAHGVCAQSRTASYSYTTSTTANAINANPNTCRT